MARFGGVAQAADKNPNILVIWGEHIGTWNISHSHRGMMGYRTPNIDRLAKEVVSFTDYYGQQSSPAGHAALVGGNLPVRTSMTKIDLPGVLFCCKRLIRCCLWSHGEKAKSLNSPTGGKWQEDWTISARKCYFDLLSAWCRTRLAKSMSG